jgi:hypothetical protein
VCAVLLLHRSIIAAGEDLDLGLISVRSASAGGVGNYRAVLVDELKVVPTQQVRDRRELGSISLCVVVELEERNSEKLHILRDAEDLWAEEWLAANRMRRQEQGGRTGLWKLDEVELLAFLGSRDVRGNEGVHEGLEVSPPPLRKTIPDLPVAGLFALAQSSHGSQPLVQTNLKAIDLRIIRLQVIAWKLEKGIGDLEHQYMGVVVLVADENALAGAAHAVKTVMLLEPLKSRQHGWVLLRLGLLDAEGVVRERVEADGLRLVGVKGEGDDRRLGRLLCDLCNCRHFGGVSVGN